MPSNHNCSHFRPRHLLHDIRQTVLAGLPPGATASDFELSRVGGGTRRLSDLRASRSCCTSGVYLTPCHRLGRAAEETACPVRRPHPCLDVFIRQAHPGGEEPAYRSFAQKLRDAERQTHVEAAPWEVLVDDLDGTVHRLYGGLPDPSYLIDSEGRIAFFNAVTHAPTLHTAIEALLAQGGRGLSTGSRSTALSARVADGGLAGPRAWSAGERGRSC